MLLHVSKRMMESKDVLTQADKAIGDGDHGVGMARGFEAVAQKLAGDASASVGDLLAAVGAALMASVGGASGAVFGTLFRGGAKNLKGAAVLDSHALSLLLLDGLAAVQQRGKAKVGDKTMVDALTPAVSRAKEMEGAPIHESLPAVAGAARAGMEATKPLVASVGKAKTLGERAVGHPDPGAVSVSLILQFMAEFVANKGDAA